MNCETPAITTLPLFAGVTDPVCCVVTEVPPEPAALEVSSGETVATPLKANIAVVV